MTDHDKIHQMMDKFAHEIIRMETMGRLAVISNSNINIEFLKQVGSSARLQWQVHYVGSMQEGFYPSVTSDRDMMICNTTFPIVLWNSQEKERGAYVIAELDSKHPVYLRLKVVEKQRLDETFRIMMNQNGYLKNTDFIKFNYSDNFIINTMPDIMDCNFQIRQGPSIINSVRQPDGTTCSMDSVPCLICRSWPPFTIDFFTRKRLNNWPPQKLLDKVKDLDCHVVPVGYFGSKSKEIEWRLSFSIVERVLIIEMLEPYYECMFALKSIKKKYITYSDVDKPTPFCSYFIKTACLWMCETFPHKGYTVMDLIRKVLDWLIDCYQHKHLPHYFIPQHNLISHLSKKCCGNVRKKLAAVKRSLWTKVLLSASSDDACYLKKFLCYRLNATRVNGDPDYSKLETTLLIHPEATSIIEGLNVGSGLFVFLEKKSRFAQYATFNYPYAAGLGEDVQKLGISSTVEKITLSIVENIEEIVPKGYSEMHKTNLYRYLGDLYTHLCTTNRGCDEAQALYQKKSLHYYSLGAKMVFPDNCSDYGIGGKILAVKYHYIMGNYEELKMMCDSILLDSCLSKENCRLADFSITKVLHSTTTANLYGAQAIDEIFHYLFKCSNKVKIYCHPIILVLYIKARVLLSEEDTENALNLVKKMKDYEKSRPYLHPYKTTKMFITIIESLVGLLGVMRIFKHLKRE